MVGTIAFLGLGYLSSYIGWYGYKKWTYRVGTSDINESKKREVFVNELNYQIEGYIGNSYAFTLYIEKGFKYGHNSSEVTVPLINTDYPYQISFSYIKGHDFGVVIPKEELAKFDSSNASWGYLKLPRLKDTITIKLFGENNRKGTIKIWSR